MDSSTNSPHDLPADPQGELERIRALATQEFPAAERFSKVEMVCVLEELVRVERLLASARQNVNDWAQVAGEREIKLDLLAQIIRDPSSIKGPPDDATVAAVYDLRCDKMHLESRADLLAERCEQLGKQAETLRYDRDQLEEKCERLEQRIADQDSWIWQYTENSARIGKALEPIRQKRHTGEPARSDAQEVTELVPRYGALLKEREQRAADVRALVGAVEALINDAWKVGPRPIEIDKAVTEALEKVRRWVE